MDLEKQMKPLLFRVLRHLEAEETQKPLFYAGSLLLTFRDWLSPHMTSLWNHYRVPCKCGNKGKCPNFSNPGDTEKITYLTVPCPLHYELRQ